jgi:hypothetical protein
MPNGGMRPCCFICDFAEHDEPRRLINPLQCRRHGVQIWFPYKHFCGHLTTYGKAPRIIKQEQIQVDTIYAEIEVQYQTPAYPTLPQYYHDYRALAAVEVYQQWSLEEKQTHYREIAIEVEEDFKRRFVDPPAGEEPGSA